MNIISISGNDYAFEFTSCDPPNGSSNRELREDFFFELREDLTIELRE